MPLNAVINLSNAQRSLLFTLIVLHQQPGHGCTQRLLPRSQRDSNLRPRFRLVGIMRQCKGPIHRIPELRDRILQILFLLGSAIHRRNLLLAAQRVVQIRAHALELRRPRRQRVGLIVIQHVAHRQRQRVQIVLDAKQLERIFPVAVHQIVLQFAQARNLPRDVRRISDHGRQGNNQPQK